MTGTWRPLAAVLSAALACAGAGALAADPTPTQAAVAKYNEAVSGLDGHLSTRYAAYRAQRRGEFLKDPVDRYVFHLANLTALEATIAARGVEAARSDAGRLLTPAAWPRRPTKYGALPSDPIAQILKGANTNDPNFANDRAAREGMFRLLCEPIGEAASAGARLAPLAAAGGDLAAAARPSGLSGIALLAHSLSHDYSVTPATGGAAPEYDVAYYDALRACVGDLDAAARTYRNMEIAGGSAEVIGFLGGIAAFKSLFDAVNAAVDGLGRMIENRRIEKAVKEYVRGLEPFPAYSGMDKRVAADAEKRRAADAAARARNLEAIKAHAETHKDALKKYQECKVKHGPAACEAPPPPELEPELSNVVRESFARISDDVNAIVDRERLAAAQLYYVEYLKYADTLREAAPGRKILIEAEDNAPVILLPKLDEASKDQRLSKGGQTSSARFEAINARLDALGVSARSKAVLDAAGLYDNARLSGEIESSLAVLKAAWTGLVRYAYEPDAAGLGDVLGFLTEVKKSVEALDKAFADFDKAIKALDKKDEGKPAGGEAGAPSGG